MAHVVLGRRAMMDLKTIFDAITLESALGEALGPLGAVAFLALAATLFGVTLGVLVRGLFEQNRAPSAPARPLALGRPEARAAAAG